MSSVFLPPRRPLTNRYVQGPSNPSPSKQTRNVSGSKRPHSPEHGDVFSNPTVKRVRASAQESTAPPEVGKDKKVMDREQKAVEFREKYTRAFPTWSFYFDTENLGHNAEQLKARIQNLGAKSEIFFSSEVTHVITDLPIPSPPDPDKENSQNANKARNALKSPIKLLGREPKTTGSFSVVKKAVEFNIKIWSAAKLESVLTRCLVTPPVKSAIVKGSFGAAPAPQRSLSRLLQTEKIHGTTERDPTQKRHDYHYFSRGSCFVLLEDIHQELSTIAAHEYPIFKDRDKMAKKPWPVLHCHPQARNPFVPFDDREKKRWERLQQAEKTQEEERMVKRKKELEALKRKAEAYKPSKGNADLRRTVSVSNLHRRHSVPTGGLHDGPCQVDLDADLDDIESTNASGYIAASGNSVGITSTTGTTSTSGRVGRNLPLPAAMLKNHVVTSLKFPIKDKSDEVSQNVEPTGTMGPPSQLPTKQSMLKKSKSTNTLRLPKRQEGVKPGYCESCRAKFSDFTTHTVSKKHKKFATNPANFYALDAVIDRVRRKASNEIQGDEHRKMQFLYGKDGLEPVLIPHWPPQARSSP